LKSLRGVLIGTLRLDIDARLTRFRREGGDGPAWLDRDGTLDERTQQGLVSVDVAKDRLDREGQRNREQGDGPRESGITPIVILASWWADRGNQHHAGHARP